MTKPRLLIVTERLPPAFHFDLFNPRRGTEKFYYYTAQSAVELGFDVDVEMDGDVEGVCTMEAEIEAFGRRTERPFYDKILVCNPRGVDPTIGQSYPADVTVWHDFHFGANVENYAAMVRIADAMGSKDLTAISEFSRSQHVGHLDRVRAVPLGIDRGIYYPPATENREKVVAYTSSPDRGLAVLQRFWQERRIAENYGYQLRASHYASKMSDRAVAQMLRAASFWIHPGIGNELFCLAAVEAQACGATPLVVPNGALAETVKCGYRFTLDSFFDGVEAVLAGDATMKGVDASHVKDWATVTSELLRL